MVVVTLEENWIYAVITVPSGESSAEHQYRPTPRIDEAAEGDAGRGFRLSGSFSATWTLACDT